MRLSPWMAVGMVAFTVAAPASAAAQQRPRTFVDLSYPPEALAARTEGVVIVKTTTDGGGRVVGAEPIVGPASLARAVVASVKEWTFAPGPTTNLVVFRFEIDGSSCNDDSRSLFRLKWANLAVVTACTGPGRRYMDAPDDPLLLRSLGSVPVYPEIARNARVRGVVILELSVDGAGAVTDVRALNDLPMLAQAAVAHARTWQVYSGRPGPRYAVYEFDLENFECKPGPTTFLARVSYDYVRLIGCTPEIQAATRGGP